MGLASSSALGDDERERLQEVEVDTAQCERGMLRVAQGGEFPVVLALEVRAQAFAPGSTKNRLDEICLVRRRERRQ